MGYAGISAAAPVVRVIDGRTLEFPMLVRSDLARLCERWAAEDRARLLARCREAKCTAQETAEMLARFDREAAGIAYGYMQLFDLRRCGEVVLESMRKRDAACDEATLDGLGLLPDEMSELACAVWGFRRAAADAQHQAGEEAQRPLERQTAEAPPI